MPHTLPKALPHTLPADLPLDELRARYETLQAHLARYTTVQQQLIGTRDRLDRELARFAAIHRYNTRAIGVRSDEQFAEITAEAAIDVFELEFALLWCAEGGAAKAAPDAAVGLDEQALPHAQVARWWAEQASGGPAVRTFAKEDPALDALGLDQLVIGRCLGSDGRPLGLLIAGSTRAQSGFYDRISDEHLESFTVFSQQVGALLQSRRDRALIQQQLGDLRLSEERLAQSLDGGGMGLWDWDLRNDAVFFSERWFGMLGYGPDELSQHVHTWMGLMHPDEAEGVLERVQATLDNPTEGGYQNEHRLRCRDGRWAWILARGKVLCDPQGKPTRMVGVHVDISDRKAGEEALRRAGDEQRRARQEAEEANRAKSAFLAAMSHEIRTPMNGVLGMLQLLNGTELSAEQRRLTETGEHSALALLAIINDILDLSKIEAGKTELESIPFDPADTIEDVTRLLDHRAQERGLRVHRLLQTSLPARVRGDPGRFRQVLTNLLGNALKFTEVGEVRVAARWEQREDGGWLMVDVTDTGIGIPKDTIPKLFSPFTQADASTTRRYGGTGLGLSISRRLVELMGGELRVESTVGVGSTFSFAVRADAMALPATPAAPARDAGAARRPLRVLVAEDNPVNQLVAEMMLRSLGCSAVIAADGEKALEQLAAGAFDLVLMDMQMPVMDGLEATRRLRAKEAATGAPRLPVVALTANAMAENRVECLASGMDQFLPKPIRIDELQAMLARWRT